MMTDTIHISFHRDTPGGEALVKWWNALDERRGDRAALRRCRSPVDVCFEPALSRLMGAIGKERRFHTDSLALMAGLLAQVRTDSQSSQSLGSQLAAIKQGGDQPTVSETRFRRLLKITDPKELYPDLVRIIKLLNGSVDLCRLANAVYWWNDQTRQRLALDYYGAIPHKED